MRTQLLTASMAALLGAVAVTQAIAQSGSTTYSDAGSSIVYQGIGDTSSSPVFRTQIPDPELPYFTVPPQTTAVAPAPKKKNPAAGAHKGVFYANDFSYLTEDYTGPTYLGDGLKNLTVGKGKLDIGGEIRTRYHYEQGLGQQAGATRFQDTENEFGLFRLRLYADYQATDRLRFFAEGIYADIIDSNEEYIPRPIDRNRGDFLNLFADLKVTDNTTVRIGRQELLYGAQRTVSPLDWVNTRQRFDGVRTISKWGDWSIDAWYTQFVPVVFDSFDNPNENLDFYGTYATYSGFEKDTLELYYIGFNDDTGPDGNFNIDTFGTRVFGGRGDWSYEFEGAIQTGVQNALGQDHQAAFGTFGLGRSFKNAAWKPNLWFYYDIATGDDPNTLDTFERNNQLFPLAHKYLGFIDALTRNNVSAPNVRLTMKPTEKLSLLFWYYNFQSVEDGDPITSIGGTPAQDPNSSDFGNELDIIATYQLSPRRNVLAGYSRFWAGDRIIDGEDADFFYLQFTTNF